MEKKSVSVLIYAVFAVGELTSNLRLGLKRVSLTMKGLVVIRRDAVAVEAWAN